MAIHILRKLVLSARLYMKMASWGFCVLVFDSSGGLVTRPEERVCGDPCSSGTHLVVGRSASEEESIGAAAGAPMEIPSSS